MKKSKIIYLDATASTNDFLLKNAGKYEGEDLVVAVSDYQTAGHGMGTNKWESEVGKNLLFSMLIHPLWVDAGVEFLVSMSEAIALCEVLSEYADDITIKWPNDIVMNGKKVCGILTEMSAQFDYINHIVIGIGINVHNEDFPEEIAKTASSLYLESGQHIHRASLIEAFLEEFEDVYAEYLKTEDMEGLQKEYDAMLVNRGRQVRVLDPKEPFEGKAMGITKKGELIVDTWESRKLVSSGEVSVRGIYGYV